MSIIAKGLFDRQIDWAIYALGLNRSTQAGPDTGGASAFRSRRIIRENHQETQYTSRVILISQFLLFFGTVRNIRKRRRSNSIGVCSLILRAHFDIHTADQPTESPQRTLL